MSGLLQSDHLSVLEAKTKEELLTHIVRFAHGLGFQTVTASVVVDHFIRDTEFIWIDNGPVESREMREDPNVAKRDPVMQHCKHKSVPIIWNQATYIDGGQAEMWEEQARFGYRHGICLALHMPMGRHFLFGVDRDQPMPDNATEVTCMVAALCLYAIHAYEASTRVLLPVSSSPEAPLLTRRELEALRWTMDGKTAWEVGRILGISEQTVIRHVHSASRKLEATNKHHAAIKALRLGLIG